jgi:prophage regulatory protein
MRMLTIDDLRAKGIKWSRQHIHRKVRRGEFPRPVKLGSSTNAWPESEVDAFLEARVAERDAAVAEERARQEAAAPAADAECIRGDGTPRFRPASRPGKRRRKS